LRTPLKKKVHEEAPEYFSFEEDLVCCYTNVEHVQDHLCDFINCVWDCDVDGK